MAKGPVRGMGGMGVVPGLCLCTGMCGQVLSPLVGRVLSRAQGGSLPAGGWECVYSQLVAWPEVSQYWCLQAGRQGQGWVLRLIS